MIKVSEFLDYAIEKTAKTKKISPARARREFLNYDFSKSDMSPEEYSAFVEELKNHDDVMRNTNFVESKRDKSMPMTFGVSLDGNMKETAQSLERLKKINPNHPVFGKMQVGKYNVLSPRSKEVTLHEAGHMADYSKNRDEYNRLHKKYKANPIISTVAPTVGSAAATSLLPRKAGIPLAIAGTGAAAAYEGYKGYKDGRLVQLKEDRANKYVEDYFTKQYGSREKAKQHIEKSVIPTARRTYDDVHVKKAIKGALIPTAFGTYGAITGMGMRR